MGVKFTVPATELAVTIMMFVMVFLMPLADHIICSKLGISLRDGVSENPKADDLLHIRKIILVGIFMVYLAILGYVAFFSRSAANDYLLHISFYQDLSNSIKIDYGVLELIKILFTKGPGEALSHVKIVNMDDFMQVYLNIVMFVPMGYLLPYVFDWYRRSHITAKVTFTSFLATLLIENIQLITKLGFYDCDDIISNTFGGFLGQHFYIMFAYVLVHPDFRKEALSRLKWRIRSLKSAFHPFYSKLHVARITVYAQDKDEVREFYEDKLGFRLKKAIDISEDETNYLFDFRKNQIEVRCSPSYKDLPLQNIVLACNNSEFLKEKLDKHGISCSGYEEDPYTGLRIFTFMGPDEVYFTIIEE